VDFPATAVLIAGKFETRGVDQNGVRSVSTSTYRRDRAFESYRPTLTLLASTAGARPYPRKELASWSSNGLRVFRGARLRRGSADFARGGMGTRPRAEDPDYLAWAADRASVRL